MQPAGGAARLLRHAMQHRSSQKHNSGHNLAVRLRSLWQEACSLSGSTVPAALQPTLAGSLLSHCTGGSLGRCITVKGSLLSHCAATPGSSPHHLRGLLHLKAPSSACQFSSQSCGGHHRQLLLQHRSTRGLGLGSALPARAASTFRSLQPHASLHHHAGQSAKSGMLHTSGRVGGILSGGGSSLQEQARLDLRWQRTTLRGMATSQPAAQTGGLLTRAVGRISVKVLRVASHAQAAHSVRRVLGDNLTTAASLHFRAWWQSNNRFVYGFMGLVVVYLLWKLLFKVASMFINLTESMAEYGFMGLALTIVVLSTLYVRRYFGVSAPTVYRNALVRLNMSPAVLEVMGPPLAGSPVRAYVVTGGGLYLSKSLRPKVRPRRIQMIFPLSGKERRGLVSLEAKKKQGQYVWKLLAVDLRPEDAGAIAAASGNMHASLSSRDVSDGSQHPERIYVDGDLSIYQRGGVLSELRDPFLRALDLQPTFEREDEQEDEAEELRYIESRRAKKESAEEAKRQAAAIAAVEQAEASVAAAAHAEASEAAMQAAHAEASVADAEAAAAAEAHMQAEAAEQLQSAANAHAARVAAIAEHEARAAAAALAAEEAAAHLAVQAPPPPHVVVITEIPAVHQVVADSAAVAEGGGSEGVHAGTGRSNRVRGKLGEWLHESPKEANTEILSAALDAAAQDEGNTKQQSAWSRWFSGPK